MKTTQVMAAAATLSTVAAQYGSMAVVNRCPFDLYLWAVPGGEPASGMITLPGNTPTTGFKQPFRRTKDGGGVSIKVAPNHRPGNAVPDVIAQLEFALADGSYAPVADQVFYDLSWVNDDPFKQVALTMQTSAGCPYGTCAAGDSTCDVGYLWDKDDVKTHSCGNTADIIFTFCSTPGSVLTSPKGLLQNSKREAIADPLAVCVGLDGGIAQLCPDTDDTPAPSSSSSSVAPPAPTTTKAAPTPAPVVALQAAKPAVSSSSSSSVAPAPVATPPAVPEVVAPIASAVGSVTNSLVGTAATFLQLTNLDASGVKTWLSASDGVFARSIEGEAPVSKREAHSHNHAHNHLNFHRRNRIIKSKA